MQFIARGAIYCSWVAAWVQVPGFRLTRKSPGNRNTLAWLTWSWVALDLGPDLGPKILDPDQDQEPRPKTWIQDLDQVNQGFRGTWVQVTTSPPRGSGLHMFGILKLALRGRLTLRVAQPYSDVGHLCLALRSKRGEAALSALLGWVSGR